MYPCRTNRHTWLDPVSAARCCDPQWRRELRFGIADRIDGDAADGATVVAGGGGQMFVWHRIEEMD